MTAKEIGGGHADARAVCAAMVADLEPLYGPIDGDDAPSATPAEMSAPHGAFVVLYGGEVWVAGGGIKRLDDETAEIKRMYVVPDARGKGLARMLLAELEGAARNLGYRRVRLDTGPQQPHARALYESAGYEEIADYNANPHASYWGEKRL